MRKETGFILSLRELAVWRRRSPRTTTLEARWLTQYNQRQTLRCHYSLRIHLVAS